MLAKKRGLLTAIFQFISLRFDGCIALELGAGLGLCSIVLGRVAKKVFCTGMVLRFTVRECLNITRPVNP